MVRVCTWQGPTTLAAVRDLTACVFLVSLVLLLLLLLLVLLLLFFFLLLLLFPFLLLGIVSGCVITF